MSSPASLQPKPRILVVDDDSSTRECFSALLAPQADAVTQAASLEAARAVLARAAEGQLPDVVLLDYRLPDGTCLDLITELKQHSPDVQIIVITGHGGVTLAVEAMHRGAFFFLEKPCDADQLEALVARALEHKRMRAGIAPQRAAGPQLVAESLAMREVRDLLARYAESPSSTVLITGESGVGKDVAARVLHECSARAAAPFVTITCSAIPEALLESELFGHERGAFTDARARKLGLIEQANGGCVFLDEIGELPLSLQAKLLRFLEEHSFRRLGGTQDIHADVRIVAATHRDLRAEVLAGRFRRDLYYRLSVLQLVIPPLRERSQDVAPLAQAFVERFNRKLCKQVQGIAPEALSLLEAQPWPGNARELRNVIERAIVLTREPVLSVNDLLLEPSSAPAAYALPPDGVDLASVERDLVKQALARASGNQTRAAKLLGISRDQIRYRIEKFQLQASELE
jgi:two-component system response regulator AtoC